MDCIVKALASSCLRFRLYKNGDVLVPAVADTLLSQGPFV